MHLCCIHPYIVCNMHICAFPQQLLHYTRVTQSTSDVKRSVSQLQEHTKVLIERDFVANYEGYAHGLSR